MAIQPTKGTVLNFVVAGGVLAAVAQVISIDVSEATTETYEARTLDQSGPSIVSRLSYHNLDILRFRRGAGRDCGHE